MSNNEILTQLAGRMGTNAEQARVWLEAVLDILHGAYATGGAAEMFSPRRARVQEPTRSAAQCTPVLRSITPTARLSIGDEVVLDRFPFRVGREGRSQSSSHKQSLRERRQVPKQTSNDLYVKDFGKSVNVSREHFQIEAKEDGTFELVDRGSACGTIVGDHVIGGNFIGGRCPLEIGDCIVVGTRQSSIVFEFGLR